jgi:hypothetical protein
LLGIVCLALAAWGGIALIKDRAASATGDGSGAGSSNAANLETVQVNKAVMVTVDLDFGGDIPSVAEALNQVQRGHQPDEGRDRTFAILDARGEPTPDGKLRVSMHVSTERPGIGSLTFRRTGELLWKNRIISSTNANANPESFQRRGLKIYLDDGKGGFNTVDGSHNPESILDAMCLEAGVPVRDRWPDGEERELTFMYSACGCPVKAKVRRTGETTERTTDDLVMFPDDPALMITIRRLMSW